MLEEGEASSTAEVIFKDMLIDSLEIDENIAYNLYTGIISDMCCFTRGMNDITREIID